MHFCGVAEAFGDGSAMFKLPTLSPSWYLEGDLPGIDRGTFRRAVATACSRWEAVCGLKFSEAQRADEATLRIITHDLGGPGGVLADQQLPFRGMRQLLMRVDRGERWGIFDGRQGSGIDLVRVLTHEIGHFCSLQHLDPSPPPELMEPTYSPDIISPQPTEAKLMVSMYGSPAVAPAPQPGGLATMRFAGTRIMVPEPFTIDNYRVSKFA